MSFVQSVSFRARKLDETRPLMVVHDEAVLEAEGTPVVNRSVPDMPTGMEKEEEREAHFVRALQSHAVISIPTITTVAPVALPDEAPWKQPSHLVVYAPPPDRRVMDENNTQAEYDLTESDTEFVRRFAGASTNSSSSSSSASSGGGTAKGKRRAGKGSNESSSNSNSSGEGAGSEAECAALCDLAEALIDRYERAGYQQQRAGRGVLGRDAAAKGATALLAACLRQHPLLLTTARLQQFARAVYDYWMAKRAAPPRHGDFLQDKYKRVPEPGNLDPYTAFRARGDEWTGGSVVGSHARKRRRNATAAGSTGAAGTAATAASAHAANSSSGGGSHGHGSEGARHAGAGDTAAGRRAETERERVARLRRLQTELAQLRTVLAHVVQREQRKRALVECALAAPAVLATPEAARLLLLVPGDCAENAHHTEADEEDEGVDKLAETVGAAQQTRAQQLLGALAGTARRSSCTEDVRDACGEVPGEWQRVAFGAERDGDGSSSEDADAFAFDYVDAAEDRRRRGVLPALAQHSGFAAARPTAPGTAARTLSLTQAQTRMTWAEWVARGHAYFGRQDCVYGGAARSLPLRDPARNCAPHAQTVLAWSPATESECERDSDADDEREGGGAGREGVRRVRHGCCLRAQLGRGGRVAFDRRALEAWEHVSKHARLNGEDDDENDDDTAMTDTATTASVAVAATAATPPPHQ